MLLHHETGSGEKEENAGSPAGSRPCRDHHDWCRGTTSDCSTLMLLCVFAAACHCAEVQMPAAGFPFCGQLLVKGAGQLACCEVQQCAAGNAKGIISRRPARERIL